MIRLNVELTVDEYDFLIDMFAKAQKDIESGFSSVLLGPFARHAASSLEVVRKKVHDKIVDAKNAGFNPVRDCGPTPAPIRSTDPVSCVASGDDAPLLPE